MEELKCDLFDSLFTELRAPGNPYHSTFSLCLSVSLGVFIVSTITGNYSQVDKLWSIIPFVYTWMAVVDERTLLMAILATIWGVRLTYNFYRRGGFAWPPWTGDEDYRWNHLREGHLLRILTKPIPWMLFNFFFISFYQNILLWLTVAPSLVAWSMESDPSCNRETVPLNILDGTATILFLVFVVVETVADNQQYAFQTEKYRKKDAGEVLTGDYADGFCQSGLFSIIRKPNYAAEQSIWITFYIFSVAARGGTVLLNWSAVGCILLCILFQGSGNFTEKLTLSKYPKYADYQKRVPRYVPNLFKMFEKKKNEKETHDEKTSLLGKSGK